MASSSEERELVRDLDDVLRLLKTVDYNQSAFLLRQVNHGTTAFHVTTLTRWLQAPASPPLSALVVHVLKLNSLSMLDEDWEAPSLPVHASADEVASFVSLFKVAQLRRVVEGVSTLQLRSLHSAFEPFAADERLPALWSVKHYLQNETYGELSHVYQQFARAAHRTPYQLSALLRSRDEQPLSLYAPLACLFGLQFAELDALQRRLSAFSCLQLRQLLAILFDGDAIDTFLELKDIFLLLQQLPAPHPHPLRQEEPQLPAVPSIAADAGRYALTLVQQPPSETIYRRVLKPAPTLLVSEQRGGGGGETRPCPQLALVAKLVRCDNLEEVDQLAGAEPTPVQLGRPVTFGALKILVTSHQIADSDFAIRFELLAGPGTVVDHIQTDAIRVISHSTQLASRRRPLQLAEIVPNSGPAGAPTRCVIVGAQFAELGPALAVRFGDQDVPAEVRGPGTIVCTAPPGGLGKVSVSLVRAGQRLSDAPLTFTYVR